MKKKLCVLLLGIACCIVLAGCGTESKDAAEGGEKKAVLDKDFSIEMTGDYTFTDPEDLEFDERYVLTGDDSCKLLSDMANFGYHAVKVYDIIYAKDGAPAGEYQYFVTEDETEASGLAEYFSSQGQQVQQEGNVIYAVTDGDTLQGSITMLAGSEAIAEETVEAYVEMLESFNGFIEY